MTIIPYTKETLKYSEEAMLFAINSNALKAKKEEMYNKTIKPLERKYNRLRKNEISNVMKNDKFITYCSKSHNTITNDLYEEYYVPNGGCGGYMDRRDLVEKFGSKEYLTLRKTLLEEINKKEKEINEIQ